MTRKWLPLAPPNMPGVWFDVSKMIPDRAGAYAPQGYWIGYVSSASAPAAPGTTLRIWAGLLPAATVAYIGTTTKLFLWDGNTTFTDKSKGGGYTNTAVDWSFAQYGNISLATNRVDNLQTRDASGATAFADATGSPPKARIVITQAEQVLLFDLNDGAEKPDAFASSAPGDYTDWSGAGATTATRIRHRPGKITAAVAFRDYVLVFKAGSVYRLTYTGSTFKWKVELLSIGCGAWGKHDVVNCGDVVVFSGPGGAWKFDGASFTPITEWVGEVSGEYPFAGSNTGPGRCLGSVYSPLSGNVFFYLYAGALSSVGFVYNIYSDRWGYVNSFGGAIADDCRPLTGEPQAIRALLESGFVFQSYPNFGMMINLSGASYIVYHNRTFWGDSGGSTWAGDDAYLISGAEGIGGEQITEFRRFAPIYTNARYALASDVTPSDNELRLDIYQANSMDALNLNPSATGATATQTNIASSTEQMRFDFLKSSVYARFSLKFPKTSGYAEVQDYSVDMKPAGKL